MLKVDLIAKSWWCCWLRHSRQKNAAYHQISHKIPTLFIPSRRLSYIPQGNEDKLKPFMKYFNVTFYSMTGAHQCTLTLTTSVKMACEPAYRDIVSARDCASILPVMCFCEMARKKTPNRRWRGKEGTERASSNTLLFPQRFKTNKKTFGFLLCRLSAASEDFGDNVHEILAILKQGCVWFSLNFSGEVKVSLSPGTTCLDKTSAEVSVPSADT